MLIVYASLVFYGVIFLESRDAEDLALVGSGIGDSPKPEIGRHDLGILELDERKDAGSLKSATKKRALPTASIKVVDGVNGSNIANSVAVVTTSVDPFSRRFEAVNGLIVLPFVPQGKEVISVEAAGYESQFLDVNALKNQGSSPLVILLHSDQSFFVKVVGKNGAPIGHCRMAIEESWGHKVVRQEKRPGSWELRGLAPNSSFWLYVTAPAFVPRRVLTSMRLGGKNSIEVILSSAITMFAQVVDDEMRPIAGLNIQLKPRTNIEFGLKKAFADEHGRFFFRNLSAGRYELIIAPILSRMIEVPVDSGDLFDYGQIEISGLRRVTVSFQKPQNEHQHFIFEQNQEIVGQCHFGTELVYLPMGDIEWKLYDSRFNLIIATGTLTSAQREITPTHGMTVRGYGNVTFSIPPEAEAKKIHLEVVRKPDSKVKSLKARWLTIIDLKVQNEGMFVLPVGRYLVSCSDAFFAAQLETVVQVTENGQHVLEWGMAATASIEGIVHGMAKLFPVIATGKLKSRSGATWQRTIMNPGSGSFLVEGIPVGEWEVELSGEAIETEIRSVALLSGQVHQLELTLRAASYVDMEFKDVIDDHVDVRSELGKKIVKVPENGVVRIQRPSTGVLRFKNANKIIFCNSPIPPKLSIDFGGTSWAIDLKDVADVRRVIALGPIEIAGCKGNWLERGILQGKIARLEAVHFPFILIAHCKEGGRVIELVRGSDSPAAPTILIIDAGAKASLIGTENVTIAPVMGRGYPLQARKAGESWVCELSIVSPAKVMVVNKMAKNTYTIKPGETLDLRM